MATRHDGENRGIGVRAGQRQAREHDSAVCEHAPLAQLQRWLKERGLPSERAAFTAESVRAFYLQRVVPTFGFDADVNLGLGARETAYGGHDVFLELLWPMPLSIESSEQTRRMDDLSDAFTHGVSLMLLPDPSCHLDFLSLNHSAHAPEAVLRRFSAQHGMAYLGLLNTTEPCALARPPSS